MNMEESNNLFPVSSNDIDNYSKQKWNDKCDTIEKLVRFLNNNEKFECDYTTLTTLTEMYLHDSNINVNSAIIGLLSKLSPKLKTEPRFRELLKICLPLVVEKYKEKKEKLTDEINIMLTMTLKFSMNVGEFLTSVRNYTKDKSIIYKSAITEFVFVTLRKSLLSVINSDIRIIVDVLSELTLDNNLDVKNCAISSLALIRKRVGKVRFGDTAGMLSPNLLDEIEQIKENINYDTKFDDIEIEGKDEDVEEIEEEVEEEVEVSVSDYNTITKTEENEEKVQEEKKEIKTGITIKVSEPKEDVKIDKKENSNNNPGISTSSSENAIPPANKVPIRSKEKNPLRLSVNKKSPAKNGPSNNTIDVISKSPEFKINDTNEVKNSSLNDFEKKLAEAMKKEEENQKSKMETIDAVPSSKPKKKSEEDTEFTSRLAPLLGEDPEGILPLFDSPKWDDKKKAFALLNEFINSNKSLFTGNQGNQETLFSFIKIKLNNFKETNFNLIKEALTCFISLFLVPSDKKYIDFVIKGTYEKMSDAKLKETYSNLLNTLIENYSPGAVVNLILPLMLNDKKAKMIVMKEYCIFFEKVVDDYGANVIDVKPLISLAVTLANNSNPQARTAATSLICVLYKYIGNDIRALIKDIKESTMKVIESELEKVKVLDKNEIKPKKVIKVQGTESLPQNKDLVPRVDISKQITTKLLKEINDGKWGEKKEAIETIMKAITAANNKILPNGMKELITVIKAKLNDGNKNLVRLIVSLLGQVCEALGPNMKQFTKPLGTPLLSVLADKTSSLREECQTCIDKWINAINLESIVMFIPPLLKNENVESRTEMLKILIRHKTKFNKSFPCEAFFKELVSPLLLCLQDKSNSVRNEAEEVISISLSFIKTKVYYNAANEFKPAIANSLITVLDRIVSESNITAEPEEDTSNTVSKEQKEQIQNAYSTVVVNAKKITPKPGKLKTRSEAKIAKTPSRASVRQGTLEKEMNKLSTTKQTAKSNQKNVTKKLFIDKKRAVNGEKTNNNLGSVSVILRPKPNLLGSLTSRDKSTNIFLPNYKSKLTSKDKRIDLDRRNNAHRNEIRENDIKKVKEQLKLVFTPEQISKMFSVDAKKNAAAISLITSAMSIENEKICVIDTFDLIAKFLVFKLQSSSNTAITKSAYELCETILVKEPFEISDVESGILLNFLVDKFSSSSSSIKDSAKYYVNKISDIDMQKTFNTLLYLSLWKANKIKCEIIEVMCTIYSSGEIDISKYAKLLMKLYAGGDNTVKNKLVDLLGQLYRTSKGEFEKAAGELNEKEKKMLMDKLKVEEKEELEVEKEENISGNIITSNNISSSDGKSDEDLKDSSPKGGEHKIHYPSQTATLTLESLKQTMTNLTNPSINIIESILAVNETVYKNFSINQTLLVANSDLVFDTFISSLTSLFYANPLQVKITKYITNVLCKISTLPPLISSISFNTLKSLINLVLTSVLYDHLSDLGENNEGVVIWKSFNSIMLRIIESCDPTSILIILIEKERDSRLSRPKLAEYSARCVLKLTQAIPEKIENIDSASVLGSIHELLVEYENCQPDLQIKNQTDQIVILSVKNLVLAMTKVKREVIVEDYIKGVETKDVGDKYIKRWMKAELEGTTEKKENKKEKFETLKINIEEMRNKVNKSPSAGANRVEIQNDKLNQLKMKLTNLNKVSSIGMIKKNENESTNTINAEKKSQQHKSFNQIQKKWKDVFNRTQRGNNYMTTSPNKAKETHSNKDNN